MTAVFLVGLAGCTFLFPFETQIDEATSADTAQGEGEGEGEGEARCDATGTEASAVTLSCEGLTAFGEVEDPSPNDTFDGAQGFGAAPVELFAAAIENSDADWWTSYVQAGRVVRAITSVPLRIAIFERSGADRVDDDRAGCAELAEQGCPLGCTEYGDLGIERTIPRDGGIWVMVVGRAGQFPEDYEVCLEIEH